MRDAARSSRALPEPRDLTDQAAAPLGKHRSEFLWEAACQQRAGNEQSRSFPVTVRARIL